MRIELNGERVEVAEGASVADAVEASGAGGRTRGVAVAVEGEVVPRSAWEQTKLSAGERLEVVVAVQGG